MRSLELIIETCKSLKKTVFVFLSDRKPLIGYKQMNDIILLSIRWISLAVVGRLNVQGEEASEGGGA